MGAHFSVGSKEPTRYETTSAAHYNDKGNAARSAASSTVALQRSSLVLGRESLSYETTKATEFAPPPPDVVSAGPARDRRDLLRTTLVLGRTPLDYSTTACAEFTHGDGAAARGSAGSQTALNRSTLRLGTHPPCYETTNARSFTDKSAAAMRAAAAISTKELQRTHIVLGTDQCEWRAVGEESLSASATLVRAALSGANASQ
jgi:hypothetical protein